jgi:acylphosphatase
MRVENRAADMSDVRIIKHVIIRGRVQGVGFRAFVEHHARQRGLEGWVRNRRNGSVEAIFAGSADSVEGMVKACAVGPLSAQIDALDQRTGSDAELASRLPGDMFSCLPTT